MKRILASLVVIALMSVTVIGSSLAVFSESETVAGNTLTAATVDIRLRGLESGEISKPLDLDDMVPGEWSPWGQLGVQNAEDSTDVETFFYVTLPDPDPVCRATNLHVVTKPSLAGPETELYNGPLAGLLGYDNKVSLGELAPEEFVIVMQRAQLDEETPNHMQGHTCEWDEVFLAETL